MRSRKLITLIMIFALVAGMSIFPSGGKEESKSGPPKIVPVKMILMGGAPPAMDSVMQVANRLYEKKVGANLTVEWIDWNDFKTKYNLILATGEEVDLIYGASTWLELFENAAKGAFKDITDLVPKYMPKTWASIPQARWNQAKFEGKLIAVPHSFPEFLPRGISYRYDLSKEYGIGEIKNVKQLEQYLETYKAKTGVTPIQDPVDRSMELYDLFISMQPGWIKVPGMNEAEHFLVAKSKDDLTNIFSPAFTPEFEAFVAMTERWAEKGFWAQDILSITQGGEAVDEGAVLEHYMKLNGSFINRTVERFPGSEWKHFSFSDIQKKLFNVQVTHNCMAVPRNSKNTEKALELLEFIRTDREAYDITNYGIKGVNYDLNDSGARIPPKNYNKATDEYSISNWGFRVAEMEYPNASDYPGMANDYARFLTYAIDDPFRYVMIDTTVIDPELSALANANRTFGDPLLWGKTKTSSVETFRKALKDAGIDKVVAEITKQVKSQLKLK